jgi:hypothetical protein
VSYLVFQVYSFKNVGRFTKYLTDSFSFFSGLNKVGTRCTPKHLSGDHAGAKPEFVHPRFIYIIRNGPRPRKIFRILLNKKTAISLDQVVNTISSKISLNTGAVRKLFTMRGEKVRKPGHA